MAVKLTVYVPSSVGVKLNVDDVPEADWPVLDVTLHAYVSGVSASAPSVTVLPRLTGVPSTTLAGAPVMIEFDGKQRPAIEHTLPRAEWPHVMQRLDRLARRIASSIDDHWPSAKVSPRWAAMGSSSTMSELPAPTFAQKPVT